jgi:hypothetical protein
MTQADRVFSTPPTNTSKTDNTQSPTKPPVDPARSKAFDQACGMEDPLRGIRNFAGALCKIAGTLEGDDGMIVYELALTIQARVDELDNIHGYFCRLHHPDRTGLSVKAGRWSKQNERP